jgi:hypothetical protein
VPPWENQPHNQPRCAVGGGLSPVRDGVWRFDVELPRTGDERRRRVSRTVVGTLDEAEAVLKELSGKAAEIADARPVRRGPKPRRRAKRSAAISEIGHHRWWVRIQAPADPLTGERRRSTRTVRGSRELAEITLARITIAAQNGKLQAASAVTVAPWPDEQRLTSTGSGGDLEGSSTRSFDHVFGESLRK